MELFMDSIERFLKSKELPNNGWFHHCEEQVVYLRKSIRRIEGVNYSFVDIANILTEEKDQKRGHLTRFITHLEKLGYNLYVENAGNPVLPPFLCRIGFIQDPRMGYEECFYKIVNKNLNDEK